MASSERTLSVGMRLEYPDPVTEVFCAEETDSAPWLLATAERRTIEEDCSRLTLSLDSLDALCSEELLYDSRELPDGLAIGARFVAAGAEGGVALERLLLRDTEPSRAGAVDTRAGR